MRPGAFVISSGPASPAMNVSGVFLDPFASIGINGIFMPLPPRPGTQSGIFSLFSPPIIPFIMLIMPLTAPFATDFIASQIPEKIDFMPSHACRQFPVNTPVIKVISPWNTCITPCTIPLIASSATPRTEDRIEASVCITGTSAFNSCMNTGNIASIIVWKSGSSVFITCTSTGKTLFTIV